MIMKLTPKFVSWNQFGIRLECYQTSRAPLVHFIVTRLIFVIIDADK